MNTDKIKILLLWSFSKLIKEKIKIKGEGLTCSKLPNASVAARGREYSLMVKIMNLTYLTVIQLYHLPCVLPWELTLLLSFFIPKMWAITLFTS